MNLDMKLSASRGVCFLKCKIYSYEIIFGLVYSAWLRERVFVSVLSQGLCSQYTLRTGIEP